MLTRESRQLFSPMRHPLLVSALLCALTGTVTVRAQQPFRFFASVVDANGAPVSGLTAGDFTVTENGLDGKVLNVEPIDWPVRVTILVDNGLGTSRLLTPVRSGLKGLLKALPDGIEISLMTTAPQPRVIRRPMKDREALLEGVDRIAPDDGAAMFVQALVEEADRFYAEKGNYFPVVIAFGSTGPDGSSARERDAQRMLTRFTQRAGTVHVVMLTSTTKSGRYTGGGANQTSVAMAVTEATGGRYDNIAAESRIATVLPEIGEQVARSHALQSRQYRITVQRPPRASGPFSGVVATRAGLNMVFSADGHIP